MNDKVQLTMFFMDIYICQEEKPLLSLSPKYETVNIKFQIWYTLLEYLILTIVQNFCYKASSQKRKPSTK